jgi:hypothetical protein
MNSLIHVVKRQNFLSKSNFSDVLSTDTVTNIFSVSNPGLNCKEVASNFKYNSSHILLKVHVCKC